MTAADNPCVNNPMVQRFNQVAFREVTTGEIMPCRRPTPAPCSECPLRNYGCRGVMRGIYGTAGAPNDRLRVLKGILANSRWANA